ncbi:MAG TPA: hypothetical protein VMW17_05120 [Candidatus Binatia bacterium]|nr:hypothetical protein [Candidatus Binatia bacterium]
MSNPQKRWSLGAALGRATGSGLAGGAAGAYMGSLGGPAGAGLAGAVGAAGGFVGGFLGAVLGHWWDEPPMFEETFGSAALFTVVVSGVLDIVTASISSSAVSSAPNFSTACFVLATICGFVGSASRSLIDDWRAQQARADSGRL